MRKIRSDSVLNTLSPEQRDNVEGWLFEEGAGYQDVRDRAKRLWNLDVSLSAVGRFYRRKITDRNLGELEETSLSARAVNRSPAKLSSLRSASLKIVGKRMLEQAMNNADVQELSGLNRVLDTAERRELQRKRLELAREKFEFNAAKAARALLPMAERMKAEDLEREDARMAAIRRFLFGNRPMNDPLFDPPAPPAPAPGSPPPPAAPAQAPTACPSQPTQPASAHPPVKNCAAAPDKVATAPVAADVRRRTNPSRSTGKTGA